MGGKTVYNAWGPMKTRKPITLMVIKQKAIGVPVISRIKRAVHITKVIIPSPKVYSFPKLFRLRMNSIIPCSNIKKKPNATIIFSWYIGDAK